MRDEIRDLDIFNQEEIDTYLLITKLISESDHIDIIYDACCTALKNHYWEVASRLFHERIGVRESNGKK